MKERTVIRFLTLKILGASAIADELNSVDETEALALSTVKKWGKRFAEGRTLLYDDPRCGRPLANDLAEAISSMLKEKPYLSYKSLCWQFGIVKRTCLQVLYGALSMKNSIFIGFPMPWTRIRRPKESLYHIESFRYDRTFVLLVSKLSSLEMNHGFFLCCPRDSI
jgi:hypothetical protein